MVLRRLSLAGAAAALFTLSYPALAEEWQPSFEPGGYHGSGHHGCRCDTVIGGNGGVVVIPGVGTYAGGGSVFRVRGHGTYIFVEGDDYAYAGRDMPMEPAPRAKVIDVRTAKSPCSYEAGVCVIRP